MAATKTAPACTLATLLEHADLGFSHARGPAHRDRGVASVTCLTHDADRATIRDGDLVLVCTADAVAAGDADELARAAVEAGAAALVWPEWIGAPIPDELAAAAATAGIGVYVIPRTTRVADLISVIVMAGALPETTRFQRLLHMQMRLADSLQEDPPVEALVRELATLTDGIVGITDDDGRVEASSGVLPFVLLRQEASADPGGQGLIDVAGWSGVGRHLRTLPGEPQSWLFVARRQPAFASTYVRAAASVAASLLDATRRINEIATDQDLVMRAFVLREALETEPYENSDLLATRVGALGIDFTDETRVVEVQRARALRPARAGKLGLRDHILAAFVQIPLLVHEHDDGATILAQCPGPELEAALDRLLRLGDGLLIGVGRPIRRIGETRVSWRDATLAAQAANRARGRRIMRYDDFDLGTRMLADVDQNEMAYWVQELLAPLREKPILMEALTVYFENNLDVMAAAKRLSIHHNTLRYRLTKIEETLGGPLQSPARIASLHLALAAERSQAGSTAPLRPSTSNARRAADVGDTDVLHGGAMAPVQLGVGEPPELD